MLLCCKIMLDKIALRSSESNEVIRIFLFGQMLQSAPEEGIEGNAWTKYTIT